MYRYLYQPGEQHGDQKRRATDLIWSRNTYRLDRIVQGPGNRVLYYLQDEPDRDIFFFYFSLIKQIFRVWKTNIKLSFSAVQTCLLGIPAVIIFFIS